MPARTIEFVWEEFLEDDNAWWPLYVRVNSGKWKLACIEYNTEDVEEIIKIEQSENPNETVIRIQQPEVSP